MSKTKVTERIYNKVHKLEKELGGKLSQKEIASIVGKHQTTVGRILRASTYEEYKYDIKELHPPKLVAAEPIEEEPDFTKDDTAVIDLGADVVKQLTRIADSLESLSRSIDEVVR